MATPLAPLAVNGSETSHQLLRAVTLRNDAVLAPLQAQARADAGLLALVVAFLLGSYFVCRFCRCRWLYKRNGSAVLQPRDHAYTLYNSSGDGVASKFAPESAPRNTQRTKKKATKTMLVSEMEEPFLGPPDYEQPPPYEMSPPAYEYLPSAPPLSDDAQHSPKLV